MPEGLDIEREQSLSGTMATYAEQVLISTGQTDWKSKIEDEDSAVFLREMKRLLGPKGKYSDPYHNVMMTNSSYPPTPSGLEYSTQQSSNRSPLPVSDASDVAPVTSTSSAPASVFLLPSFEYVPTIPTDSNSIEAFIKAFILPSKLHASHDVLSRAQKNVLLRETERRRQFLGARKIDEILVLICGHGGRDQRCGVLGPILQAEFEDKLERQNIKVLKDAPAADAVEADAAVEGYKPTARVGTISHIGGHKYAGNVIVYIPPSFTSNALAGKAQGSRPAHGELRTHALQANPSRIIYGVVILVCASTVFGNSNGTSTQSLNTTSFTPFKLVHKEQISTTSSLFTLEQAQSSGKLQELWKRGVWSIEIKQPQLQIARAYTPLPPLDTDTAEDRLRLLIRKEIKGEVSNFLHRMPEGAMVEIRGPSVEYELPTKVQKVVFLAGGTGIAPAVQIAHALQDRADVSVLWANRRREDCEGGKSDNIQPESSWFSGLGRLLGASPDPALPTQSQSPSHAVVQQIEQMKKSHGASLMVDYFVDEEGSFIRPHNISTLLGQKDASRDTEDGEKLLFVSGPEGFLNYWAGPKQWQNGREVQGPLGGALGNMNLKGWKVVKL
ncbi:hypothetical protein MBLNU459_g3876t2 [Dothideomycetes sp. NU459]